MLDRVTHVEVEASADGIAVVVFVASVVEVVAGERLADREEPARVHELLVLPGRQVPASTPFTQRAMAAASA